MHMGICGIVGRAIVLGGVCGIVGGAGDSEVGLWDR